MAEMPDRLRIVPIEGKFMIAAHRGGSWRPLAWHHTRRDAQRDLAAWDVAASSAEDLDAVTSPGLMQT